jgi:hypothetical protein
MPQLQTLITATLFATVNAATMFNMFLQTPNNSFTTFNSILVVPPLPPVPNTQTDGDKTYFLWPGLQPGKVASNYQPIDNGVLQPVLTFGPTCAPGQTKEQTKDPYFGWTISGQYVNTIGKAPGFTGM